ncbi:MAG: LmeA family phospholipid-binding protein [Cyanobacteria bacterium]|nr:LmeA family phospholipid-binding protein [Cyanobacteriota bacterium]
MTATPPGSGPVLQLLASGLQFWIKQQCEAVDQLELQLHGSALQLLRGRLEGVTLVASGVAFAGLPMERVELRSGPLQLQTGPLLKGQGLKLDHPFAVRGLVVFSGPGLDRGLSDTRWRGLADGLAQELLGSPSLGEVAIREGALVLAPGRAGELPASQGALATRPEAVDGALELHSLDGRRRSRLPADPNIRIKRACIAADRLELHGEAQVSP